MVRDFTEKTYKRLKKQIDKVYADGFFGVIGDRIDDLFLNMGSWLGMLYLEEDMSNVKSYQKKVLDMTNMSKDDLKKIFKKVHNEDLNYSGQQRFGDINNWQASYNNKLNKLSACIKPNFQILSAEKIKMALSDTNDELKSIEERLVAGYDADLEWAGSQVAKEAGLGLVKDILGLAGFIINPSPLKVWSFLESFVATLGDLESLIYAGAFALSGDEYYLYDSENSADIDGFDDILTHKFGVDENSVIVSALTGMTLLSDIASIAVDGNKFFNNPGKFMDFTAGFDKIKDPSASYMDKMGLVSRFLKMGSSLITVPLDAIVSGDSTILCNLLNNYKPISTIKSVADATTDYFEKGFFDMRLKEVDAVIEVFKQFMGLNQGGKVPTGGGFR